MQFKRGKIMVVKRELLFKDDDFQGFSPHTKINYLSRILRNFTFKERSEVEQDPVYKQPLPYAVIVNPDNLIYAYMRATADKDYQEKRLQGKWSIGVGGHIIPEDAKNPNPVMTGLLRELKEELNLTDINPELIGYINDDETDVGMHHIGILLKMSQV